MMQPAFSLILFTTLIGVGQGLFLALFAAQSAMALQLLPTPEDDVLLGGGSMLALAFLLAGLAVSFFHLQFPGRAWRAAVNWRTCWLSREVITLTLVIILAFTYGALHLLGQEVTELSLLIGLLGALAALFLFVCTAMIYQEVAFVREWASFLTVVNYFLMGTASGFTAATAFSVYAAPELTVFFGTGAIIIGVAAFFFRTLALFRSARIQSESTLHSVGDGYQVESQEQGIMGLHTESVKWLFPLTAFIVPILLLYIGMDNANTKVLVAAFVVQYAGLLLERWSFYAQVSHPRDAFRMPVCSTH